MSPPSQSVSTTGNGSSQQELPQAWKDCLERDGHTCVITSKFDVEETADQRMTAAESYIGGGSSRTCQVVNNENSDDEEDDEPNLRVKTNKKHQLTRSIFKDAKCKYRGVVDRIETHQAHRIKSISAGIHSVIRSMEYSHIWFLKATPAINRIIDILSYFSLLWRVLSEMSTVQLYKSNID
ncbi:hypothetical protein AJ79_07637 [Helicocarpus griseus UAMH5409]|uniref:Uncharacterized protein n=1 Tax=Helicocarpus griseus UAMH5409 TaxID=1447875 RepID=A0A2B7X0D2_9EURO|nr:hypothetical protein AJ79_07637 [Helicocarpus griseus UAMH5409]